MSSREKWFSNLIIRVPLMIRVFFCLSLFTLSVNSSAAENTFTMAVKPQHVTVPQGGVTQANLEVVEFGKFDAPVFIQPEIQNGIRLDLLSAATGYVRYSSARQWIVWPDSSNKSISQLTITTYPDTVPGEYTLTVWGQRNDQKTVDRVVRRGRTYQIPTKVPNISKAIATIKVTVTADPAFIGLIEPVEFEISAGVTEMITPPSPNFYLNQIYITASRSINTIKMEAAMETKAEGVSVVMMYNNRHKPGVTPSNYLRVTVTEQAKPGTYYAIVTATSKGTNKKTLTRTARVKLIVPEKVDEEPTSVSIDKDIKPDEVNCIGASCAEDIGTNFGGDPDSAVSTRSVLDDLGYDKKDASNLTLNTGLLPRQNRTLATPLIKTCERCQSLADRIYELDERLVTLESSMTLWESVENDPAKRNALIKEQEENEAEQARLRKQLTECEKQCYPSTTSIQINCKGPGCTEGITGTCIGNSCGKSFDLYCPGTACAEDVLVSCSGDDCANEGTLDCETGECTEVGSFSCGGFGCNAVPTHSVLDDLDYDKTNVSNLPLNTNLFPRQNTTLVPRTQTCELCQSIADQLYELDVRLNELENGQHLWEAVQDQPAEQEKLHKEARDKKVEREKLAAKLELCQKKCPKEEYISFPESIEINCVGTGCTEGITGTCIGNSCGESFDLFCPGTGCAEDVLVSCSDDSCANEGTVDCDAGKCDGVGGFTCGDAGCEEVLPNSTPNNFISVLDDVGFDTGLGFGSATFVSPANAACPRCEYSAQVRNELIKEFNEFEERFNRVLDWIVEAKADSVAAREDVKSMMEEIKAIKESSFTSYVDEKYLHRYITENGHEATSLLIEDMSEEEISAMEEVEDSLDRKLENLEERLPKAKRDFDVKAKRFINLISKRTILIRERKELIAKLDEAAKALHACELKWCITVELIDVISIAGNPPYDRIDPIKEESDDNVATVKVINNIPISRLPAPSPAHLPFCSETHYHGSAKNCNGVLTPDLFPGNCGQGKESEVKSIPVTSCPDL
tara:strand:+ start:1662 stop:4739 length:3078 start_codon:yes stop_codon:yes gene_type:complete